MEDNIQNKFYPVRDYEIKNKAQKEQISNGVYWVYLVGFFLILALPLLNLPPWFSPPDWGKTIIFRIVLSVLIFLFLCQLLFRRGKNFTIVEFLPKPKDKTFWPFWLLVALLGIYLLATLFSLDIRFSLWGSPYRSGGFVNFAFYIIFAILMFLILRQKDWQKIWDFSIIIGIFVSIIAIFQQFGILKKFFIFYDYRPPSTIGGPIFLAIYLLLLSFLTLSFGLKTKKIIGKLFYFLSFLFLVFVAIFITQTRAAIIGLAIGVFYFLFFYPFEKKRLSFIFKILVLIVLFLAVFSFFLIKNNPGIYQNQPLITKNTINRILTISEGLKAGESRVSAYKVSLEALKSKPILGYGPENFNIGFDKFYDPSLPGIERPPGGGTESWWDRAHNFIFDIAVTAGIPALLIYLALFGVLFFKLQGLKRDTNIRIHTNDTNKPIIAHGLQATFIGYFVANFFSFDGFSSYLISFLIIGYSLHLIYYPNLQMKSESTNKKIQRPGLWKLFGYKKTIIVVLSVSLIWFIWAFNIKPFKINAQINIAEYLTEEQALKMLDNVLTKKSFLNNYLGLKYVDRLRVYTLQHPDESLEYVKKGANLLKENIKSRPYYVRNWLLLGGFMNVLISKETDPAVRQELIKEAGYYFDKARELSPKREEFFTEWCKYLLISEQHQLLKENGEKCYPELIRIYEKSIASEPDKPQHRASLAFIYRELGDLENAKKQALKIIELFPKHKKEAEEFLKSLK